MTVFTTTLSQMGFLGLLVVIGYIVARRNLVPENGAQVLSKLENNVFIPALVLGTFMEHFTPARITVAWQYIAGGCIVLAVTLPLAIFLSRLVTRDKYIRKIYTYGLGFSNFGFMGNAVVSALFPDLFMEYLIFSIPFWVMIYLWAVPALLIPASGEKGLKSRLKSFLNPMFGGMILGLVSPPLPRFLTSAVDTLGACMSPVAMLLTGMTIARTNLGRTLKNWSVYLVSGVRLLVIPLVSVAVLSFLPIPYGVKAAIVCNLSMPLGLNTIVVPSAYGLDTSVASGITFVSHLASCITIPLIFMLFQAAI